MLLLLNLFIELIGKEEPRVKNPGNSILKLLESHETMLKKVPTWQIFASRKQRLDAIYLNADSVGEWVPVGTRERSETIRLVFDVNDKILD